MFPSFRIISDGPLSGMDSFISNESFYSFQWPEAPAEALQQPQFTGEDIFLPEPPLADETPDEELHAPLEPPPSLE